MQCNTAVTVLHHHLVSPDNFLLGPWQCRQPHRLTKDYDTAKKADDTGWTDVRKTPKKQQPTPRQGSGLALEAI